MLAAAARPPPPTSPAALHLGSSSAALLGPASGPADDPTVPTACALQQSQPIMGEPPALGVAGGGGEGGAGTSGSGSDCGRRSLSPLIASLCGGCKTNQVRRSNGGCWGARLYLGLRRPSWPGPCLWLGGAPSLSVGCRSLPYIYIYIHIPRCHRARPRPLGGRAKGPLPRPPKTIAPRPNISPFHRLTIDAPTSTTIHTHTQIPAESTAVQCES